MDPYWTAILLIVWGWAIYEKGRMDQAKKDVALVRQASKRGTE